MAVLTPAVGRRQHDSPATRRSKATDLVFNLSSRMLGDNNEVSLAAGVGEWKIAISPTTGMLSAGGSRLATSTGGVVLMPLTTRCTSDQKLTTYKEFTVQSDIKVGQRFKFNLLSDNPSPERQAVVTRVRSNREEGLGPEVDFYLAYWVEAYELPETQSPTTLVFERGIDGNVYLDGRLVTITLLKGSSSD